MSRVDLYHSRRSMYNLCPFWIRNEDGVGNSEEYIYNKKPSGYFYAKEIEAQNDGQNTIMGTFLVDKHDIQLESRDDLTGMTENSIVKYNNQLWRVDTIQKRISMKETEFSSDMVYFWYITLVR